jgi:hypothetical protein
MPLGCPLCRKHPAWVKGRMAPGPAWAVLVFGAGMGENE